MGNEEVFTRVRQGFRLGKPPTCPEPLYSLMLRCWDQDPAGRPSAEEVAKEIRNTKTSWYRGPSRTVSEETPGGVMETSFGRDDTGDRVEVLRPSSNVSETKLELDPHATHGTNPSHFYALTRRVKADPSPPSKQATKPQQGDAPATAPKQDNYIRIGTNPRNGSGSQGNGGVLVAGSGDGGGNAGGNVSTVDSAYSDISYGTETNGATPSRNTMTNESPNHRVPEVGSSSAAPYSSISYGTHADGPAQPTATAPYSSISYGTHADGPAEGAGTAPYSSVSYGTPPQGGGRQTIDSAGDSLVDDDDAPEYKSLLLNGDKPSPKPAPGGDAPYSVVTYGSHDDGPQDALVNF